MPDSRPIFRPIVPVYDLLNRILSLGLDQAWRRRAASLLPKGRVLDIACGTGDLALASAARAGTRVFGTDILPEMLARAAQKNRGRQASGGPSAAGWTASTGERLAFRSESFDAATIAFGIRNFMDRQQGLREMARVLRPSGRLLILEFGVPTWPPFRALYLLYFRRLLPLAGRLLSGNARSYAYLPETVLAFPEPGAFEAEIAQAGFTVSASEPLTLGIVRLYSAVRAPRAGMLA